MNVKEQRVNQWQIRLDRPRGGGRRVLQASALTGGLSLIAVLLGGCGGESSSSPPPGSQSYPAPPPLAQATLDAGDPSSVPPATAPQPAAQAAPPSGEQPVEAPTVPARDAQQSRGGLGGGGGAPSQQQTEPSRPEEFSDWKPDDFRTARKEGDARLAEAVIYLGETKKGDTATAELLIELLTPPKEEEQPETTAPRQRPAGLGPGGLRGRLGGARPGGGLVESIIDALAQNASPPAQKALEQLVAGKLETEADDAPLLALAAIARNARDVQAFEELLYTALVAPEKLRPTEDDAEEQQDDAEEQQDVVSADQLQQEALGLMPSISSARLRTHLAQFVVDASTAQDGGAQFIDLLIEPLVDNLDAQVVLYLGENVDPAVKAELHEAFIGYSSEALDRLLGVPPGSGATPGRTRGGLGGLARRTNRPVPPVAGRPQRALADRMQGAQRQLRGRLGTNLPQGAGGRFAGSTAVTGSAERPVSIAEALENDPLMPYQVAKRLWNPQFVSALVAQAGQIEGFEDGLDVMRFAWTVPADDVRIAQRELLREHWEEGTEYLRLSGSFGREIRDPGLLLVTKSAPRREDPARRQAASNRNTTRRTGRSPGQNRRRELSDEDLAKIQWMEACEEFIRELNERFYAAAQSQGSAAEGEAVGASTRQAPRGVLRRVAWLSAAGDEGEAAEATGEPQDAPASDVQTDEAAAALSFPLHKDANVVAEYHVSWPADLQQEIEGVELSPLKVHYVRIEEENNPARVESFYQRHLKSARKRTLVNGRWLDFVEQGPEPGWRQSVDVMITSARSATPGGGLAARQPAQGRYARTDRASRRRDNNEQLVIEILSIEIHDPIQPAKRNSAKE